MAEPFLSEIRLMSFVFAPKGWALCNGQLLPINQNQALFHCLALPLAATGGSTSPCPNLRGRVPIHVGSGHTLGERGGEQAHTLSIAEIPTHTHVMQAANVQSNSSIPANNKLVGSPPSHLLAHPGNLAAMHNSSVSNIGGSQAHLNMQPFLTLSFCIALQGIFPSPT